MSITRCAMETVGCPHAGSSIFGPQQHGIAVMTTETNPSSPTSRLSPGLRTAARGSQVVVERDLPVLFQMPAVKGAKGGKSQANVPSNVPSRPAQPEKVSTTNEPAKVELPKNSPPPTRPVSQVARREPPAATRKWFDGQGKLITICFLIALTATIYFARSRTNPGANRSNDQWQKTNPGDAAGEVAKSPGMGPPAIVIPKPTPPAVAASPAAPVLPPVPAEPPIAPNVAPLPVEKVAETPPADVKLLTPKEAPAGRSSFPAEVANAPNNVAEEGPPVAPEIAAESEPRVATAPGRSSWQPNDAGPVPSVPPANYGPNNSYPPRNDGYPLNSAPAPSVGNRTAPPSAGLYPTTDPARFRYYTPSSGTAAPGNALPGNQPRYERTGSGLY